VDNSIKTESLEKELWEGSFYHVYNRGVDKRVIFQDDRDYQRFLQTIAVANFPQPIHISNFHQGSTLMKTVDNLFSDETFIGLGAYCLMPNHYHFLIYESAENGLRHFMQKLSTAYTMYFNIRNERSGALFQGRYKAKRIEDDNYLKYLFAYIHLNPVSMLQHDWREDGINDLHEAEQFLLTYPYSSYPEYMDVKRDENCLINKDHFPEYFQEAKGFSSFLNDWLLYSTFAKVQP